MITLAQAKVEMDPRERARLEWAHEQGDATFSRVRQQDNLYIGVFLDRLDHMVLVETVGNWHLARKKTA